MNESDQLKVKVTPLLKALGFKYEGASVYKVINIKGRLLYQARVYKRGGSTRYLEVHKSVYRSTGEFDHNEIVLRDWPLDVESTEETRLVYREALADLARELGSYANSVFIDRNSDYLLGLSEKRVEV